MKTKVLGVEAHAYNSSTQEKKARLWKGKLGLHSKTQYQNNNQKDQK